MATRQFRGDGRRPTFGADEKPERPADPAVRRANLRRMFGLFRPYKGRLTVVLVLIVVAAVLSSIAPFFIRDIFQALQDNDQALLNELVIGLIAIAVVTQILGVAQTYLSNVIGTRVMHDLRSAVYRHLQRMSLAFFTRTRTGEIQSRIANDIGGIQSVVTSTATSIASNLVTVVASIVAMFLLSWQLATFSLFLLPIFVLLSRRVGRERQRITTRLQSTLADMSTLVEESLSVSGILLGKTMGRGSELADRFEKESSGMAALQVQSRMAGRWVMASIQMTFSIMPALIYWYAGYSDVTIPTVVAFTTVQTRLFFPLGSLLSVGVDVQTSLALFDRIFEYLDLPVEIDERPDAVPLPPCKGDVAFQDVWFRYDADGPWTIQNVSFEVPAGTRTAIVGETGSGKTTIGYLAARLYEPERGRVLLDGIDIRDVTFESLSATVGVVSQETYLFHATIRENLRFAKPSATDEEVEEAARAAHIHDLIESLEDGYDTMVGERGYRFSGGEKQRMAIARTVLRNPAVLILDEATSALDTRTERAVQAELDRLAEGRTTITIAHRLSTIRDADQILVLDRGVAIERGTHEELLELNGAYARLVARDAFRDEEALV